ncbi:MAG: hypothetical protein IJP01_06465 [Oscillospiraceae bacterium]|nr:hypothetical protein [Oscillospiraceae bacterium]
MALNDLRLPSYQELQQQGHTNVGQQDVPRLSAEDMQRLLDYVPCEVLLPAYNNLLAALQDAAAGNDIGVSVEGLEASNVAEAMARLLDVVRNAQFAAGQMPAGGAVGQVLTKAGAGDYVTEWRNADGGMSPDVYDPRGIAADAFDAANSTFNNTAGYYTQGDVQTALQEAGAKLAAAMLKNGGSFTGVAKAMANPTDAEPQLRNVVVVDAGTDISTLSVTAGTIVMVRK